jgi:hypothetical protein
MDAWLVPVSVAVISIFASNGFWTYLTRRKDPKDALTRLLLGLAYDKIAHLGMSYIERGWISKDEYEEFQKYLYEPYKAFGGNGVAERIMTEVQNLPIRSPGKYSEIIESRRGRIHE